MPRLTHVIEQVGGWNVQELGNGLVHIWKAYSVTLTADMTAWGSVFEARIASSESWPFAFKTPPRCWVENTGGNAILSYEFGGGFSTTTGHANLWATTPTKYGAGTMFSCVLNAIGERA